MARAFDVTSATDAVRLDEAGRGEMAFTVSNVLGRRVKVRATVEAEEGAKAQWASLPEAEKELAADGTALFTVRFAIPPGTPPGRYAFHLLVADVSNPDENYARGPGVAAEVPKPAASPVQKRGFPWWAVLVGGVVLLAGIVALVLALRKGPGGLRESCSEKDPCAAGLACTTEGTCLGEEGFTGCQGGADCATGRCVESVCQPSVAPGGACTADEDCRAPALCHENRVCLLPDGSACSRREECMSGRCVDGTCRPPVSLGEACTGNEDCRAPTVCSAGFCLIPVGSPCAHPAQCVSGNCAGGTCQRSPDECFPPCRLGSICISGRCVARPIVRECSPPCRLGFACIDGQCVRTGTVIRREIELIPRQNP